MLKLLGKSSVLPCAFKGVNPAHLLEVTLLATAAFRIYFPQ